MKVEKFAIASGDVGTGLGAEGSPMLKRMAIAGLHRGGLYPSEWDCISVETQQGLLRKSYAVTVTTRQSNISATLTHTVGLLRWVGRNAIEMELACYYAGRVMRGWLDSGVSIASERAIEAGAEYYRRMWNNPGFSQYLPPDAKGLR